MKNYSQYGSWLSHLFSSRSRQVHGSARLLFLVEGSHDVAFICRLASILHRDDCKLPDLAQMERAGTLVFLPFGGGDVLAWARRLAPLAMPSIYLFDRELPPESAVREQARSIVNLRPNCRAFVTQKRSLENYLHPQCLAEARGIQVNFGDDDDVADLVAMQCYRCSADEPPWEALSGRARKRFRERAKRWLCRDAVDHMTPERLAQRDPVGEVRGWFDAMVVLAQF